VDEDPARPHQPALLAVDLATNALGLAPVRRTEFGRTEEPTLVDGVERPACQEVEGAWDTQVDPMMLERLVGVVPNVESDRAAAELLE